MRVFVVFVSILILSAILPRSHALNVDVHTTGTGVSLTRERSRKCESEFCTVQPFLRYGKYCGILDRGCPGEKPCDGLRRLLHEAQLLRPVQAGLLNCMGKFKKAGGGQTFKGNKCDAGEVIDVISVVGKVLSEIDP